MNSIKALGKIVVILFLLFLFAFIGVNIIMKLIVGHRNEVMVPNLIGMDFDVAVKTCKDLKLYIEGIENINSDEFEKGKIISQDPHPDIRTKRFRTIKVAVSEGPEMIRIPFLENLTITEAKLRLENAGLYLGEKKYRYSEEVEKDRIIYSQPTADALIARRSTVDVVVSLGQLSNSSSQSDKWKNLLDQE
ncbi:MAG: PASTA domain-containing protein [Candidatus Cloacimonetes bacterium]|nr:PASTA domain-containing protein [Candidatus Cloacimonadota bacterium]